MHKFDRADVDLCLTGRPAGRSETREKTRSYHTVAHTSEVDESLFRSSNTKIAASSSMAQTVVLAAPRSSDGLTGGQLSLTPDVRQLTSAPSTARSSFSPPRSFHGTSSLHRSRSHNKYRLVRHTPTYVDEMLFGRDEDVRSSKWRAPWNKEHFAPPLLFDPVDHLLPLTPRLRPQTVALTRTSTFNPKSPWK